MDGWCGGGRVKRQLGDVAAETTGEETVFADQGWEEVDSTRQGELGGGRSHFVYLEQEHWQDRRQTGPGPEQDITQS